MTHPVIKKLQLKDTEQPILILNAPKEYEDVIQDFPQEVHKEAKEEAYPLIQVFGTTNEALQEATMKIFSKLAENGLLWLCYPKKSSKTYRGSNCSRETVAQLLAEAGFEPVRQVAIDDDWSALRFKHVDTIKTMTRSFAVTEAGKKRTEK
ncbi:DUF3052 family protein [Halalkalibacterium halodurans]|uniref:DUF3052 family protein n=1 Tax=Halalkalibacterium halodurans TaxID=86665 RepID=UPI001067D9A5|nr:DUF3052 family protein [Halalkalibacterium halodurans]TES48881.1 DUF3052 family protein [Halalkalibacterium halodurans]